MQNNNYQQPKKPTPLWMILVPVIVGALIVTGVAAYFVLNAKSKPVPVVVDEDDEDDEEEHYTVRMSGYVGQYPVRMRLEVEGNVVSGNYYYESQGPEKRLLLNGTLRNGRADLNETTVEGQPTGHFRGRLTRRTFEGDFINGQGDSMYFSLSK